MSGPIEPLPAIETWIVMSTWNGEKFLPAQLDSIARQTETDWGLLVRDDGSTDGTVDLLQTAACRDSRIHLLPDDGERLGASTSFARLLEHAFSRGARYIFCCDQDDVWVPHKLARQCGALKEAEACWGSLTPILVHTDANLVDEAGRGTGRTFTTAVEPPLSQRGLPLVRLLLGNAIPGCVTAVNRALLRQALPPPPAVAMHDWWLALNGVVNGQIVYLAEPLVDYRQHGRNSIGAASGWSRVLRAVRRLLQRDPRGLTKTIPLQAGQLLERITPGTSAGKVILEEQIGCSPRMDDANTLQNLKLLRAFVGAFAIPNGWRRRAALTTWAATATQAGHQFTRAERIKLELLSWSTFQTKD